MNRIIKRVVLPLGAAAVVGTTGFAYMATNTVPQSYAGGGQNAISGYEVSNIHYTYVENDGNPNLNYIKSVSFTLNHAAHQVSAQINNNQTWDPYDNCTSGDNYNWVCQFSDGNKIASLNYPGGSPSASQLHVSAAQ